MLLKVSVNSVDILCYLQNNMMYAQIICLLGGFNCFLFCYKLSGLCILYHFLLKNYEAANQNCTYKLSCGIDVRQAITGKKGIVIIMYHIVIFYISIALGDYGVYRHFQQYFSFIVGTSSIGRGNRSTQRKAPTFRNKKRRYQI